MDALPVFETTKLPYASTVRMRDTDGIEKSVMHACGHDMHVTCLMAASTFLYAAREDWNGTLLCVFQPNEECGGRARTMINDGLYSKHDVPVPNVVLGQHVVNSRAGMIATERATAWLATTILKFECMAEVAMEVPPQDCIEPVVLACYIVIRLQSIVGREIDPNSMALITCGSIHAGDAPNVIPDDAVLKVDIKAYSPTVLQNAVTLFKRIVTAECEASVPPLISSPEVTEPLSKQFKAFFGELTGR